ncbi:MAG: EamA family transporter [Christensenellales bacterium]|jgi:drug/metabolite transporter (DMT)-like permease
MGYVLLAVTIFTIQVFANKEFTRQMPAGLAGMMIHNALTLAIAAAICACFGGLAVPDGTVLKFSLIAGVNFTLLLTMGLLSVASGPLGLTSLLTRAGMLIPTVVGCLFWGESVTWLKVAGVACMLGLFALNSLGEKEAAGDAKWLLFTALAMVLSGLTSTISKSYTRAASNVSELTYCMYWFLCTAIICSACALVLKMRGTSLAPWLGKTARKKQLLLSFLAGAGTAGGNLAVMYGFRAMEASLLIPLIEGGIVLLSVFLSVFLYREKCTKKTILSAVVGIAGIVLLGAAG